MSNFNLEGVAIHSSLLDKQQEATREHPFVEFYYEDKSRYKTATEAGYIDPDNDFLIGDSGGFLLNINFKFVNTDLLKQAALHKETYGTYTNLLKGSTAYEQWLDEEDYRKIYGFTAKCKLVRGSKEVTNLRITGAHYAFLNYYQIKKLDKSSIVVSDNGVGTGQKIMGSPDFFEPQYWYYKIKEFIKANGFHCLVCKTRRAGLSHMEANDSANIVNSRPASLVMHVADDKKYLIKRGGLTDLTFNQLNYYENDTPFARGIYKTDKEDIRLGYKDQKSGLEKGIKSALISLSIGNDPEACIGKDGEVKVEEFSTVKNYDTFYSVTEPATRTGSYTTSNIFAWGTAGTKDGDYQLFESLFYDPKTIKCMAFENVWDENARHTVCGFYKPYIWGLEGTYKGKPAMDRNGNPDFEVAMAISDNERKVVLENAKTFSDYVVHCGQYGNSPSESFNSVTTNIFSSTILNDHIEQIKHNNDLPTPIDGKFEIVKDRVIFVSNEEILAKGGKPNKDFYDWIENVPRRSEEHPHGCVRRWLPPLKENGIIPKGLYSATYDPVGINKDNNQITLQHSHNSISIWMNPHYINGYKPALVCSYYGRPETLEEADTIFFLMCKYYGIDGDALVEVNRGETVSNAKQQNALNILQKEPTAVWNVNDETKDEDKLSYGIIISDGKKKDDCLRLYKEYLYKKIGVDSNGNDILVLHRIYDLQKLIELKKWSPKGNYDRVSEMILRGVQDKNADILGERKQQVRQKANDRNHPLDRDWF